ncbi:MULTISPECIES: hypothetical protein [unclassified Granulicatella]|uniref:hypothetical protein n=1 Tax=unclassified Granulicatella TaxID=2630493 RepID=UPI001072FD4F|nr:MULTISPECIES: hypothetical protein [unclassified Granulicatella]MBF0781171.1 hypothetical protein [Granulicatella sp. 19428wC4_WM01]TFU91559.1 hypothetical protein E4T68_08865 [Granulicatella sp. WM01]
MSKPIDEMNAYELSVMNRCVNFKKLEILSKKYLRITENEQKEIKHKIEVINNFLEKINEEIKNTKDLGLKYYWNKRKKELKEVRNNLIKKL